MKQLLVAAVAALVFAGGAFGAGPRVSANVLVDLDHGALFPQNKQNEPSIARDPNTGALVAGANDELSLNLCTEIGRASCRERV